MSLARAFLLMYFVVSGPDLALACRCVEPPVRTAYRNSSAAILVKVTAEAPGGTATGKLFTAEVEQSWKRNVERTVQISTDTDCAYPMVIGEKYLLFIREDKPGVYSTGKCMGNLPKSSAAQALAWLRRKKLR